MNAHVNPTAFTYYTPQERAQQALNAALKAERVKGISEETAIDIFFLLTQIYLQAAEGTQMAQEFIEGRGNDELRSLLIEKFGFIKSNLIYIGSVIDGNAK